MAEIPKAIQRFAEEPDAFLAPPAPPGRRIRTDRFTLGLSPSPTMSIVSSLSASEGELDGVIADVRRLAIEAGYVRTTWVIGPSARPTGLPALLAARGFVPATRAPLEPHQTGMALFEPPPPATLEARAVRSFEEYLEAQRIAVAAFGQSDQDAAGWRAAAPALWKQHDAGQLITYLAFLEGRAVGFAFAAIGGPGVFLGGSGVLPEARGRGAYRALLAVRWEDAVRLGTPTLVIQAGAMAQPILERCGFQTVCRIDLMDDPAVGPRRGP
jgi:GNAT superfamily N-acetyltransferase